MKDFSLKSSKKDQVNIFKTTIRKLISFKFYIKINLIIAQAHFFPNLFCPSDKDCFFLEYEFATYPNLSILFKKKISF
jgi:hypothetical protein